MKIAWRKYIDEINTTADSYLLCVSGGVDSMFMLDFFARKSQKPLRVAHFNHKLRETSDRDEAFVRNTCKELNVECLIGIGDPIKMKNAASLEAEARDQRYTFFESIALDTDMLVTAHHANDQVETVLMRLMRGYPDDQLRMKKINGNRYKPFLELPKNEILNQADRTDLKWMEDETNTDLIHERNWVRNVIIPQMMERRNVIKTIGIKDI